MNPRAQLILDFWFVETPSEKRFKKDEKFDQSIRENFLNDYENFSLYSMYDLVNLYEYFRFAPLMCFFLHMEFWRRLPFCFSLLYAYKSSINTMNPYFSTKASINLSFSDFISFVMMLRYLGKSKMSLHDMLSPLIRSISFSMSSLLNAAWTLPTIFKYKWCIACLILS